MDRVKLQIEFPADCWTHCIALAIFSSTDNWKIWVGAAWLSEL